MRLKLTCKSCRRNIEIEGDHIASAIECPNCSGRLDIPSNILDVDAMVGGFKVVKHLGSGSMGCVYLAKQVSMDRPVALKVLPPEMTENEEELESFLQEVRLLAKLDHTNIVTAFEAGEAGGNYYMAMTYVDGETLEDKVEREGPLKEEEAVRVAGKIAEALKYAWEKHMILHRDVKPENIMIDDQSKEPKLLDMGISKTLNEDSSKTVSGALVGTPHYMSPEQAQGKGEIDFRADMYSLGCSLYQFVTGAVPYDGESVMQVLTRHALDPFPSPLKINPDLSEATVELIRVMMAKKAEDRFDSWDDLLKEIRRTMRAMKNGGQKTAARGVRVPRPKPSGVAHKSDPPAAIAEPVEEEEEPKEPPPPWLLPVKILSGVAALLLVGLIAGYALLSNNDPGENPKQGSEEPVAIEDPTPIHGDPDPKPSQSTQEALRKAEEFAKLRREFERLEGIYAKKKDPNTQEMLRVNYTRLLNDAAGSNLVPKIRARIAEIKANEEAGVAVVLTKLKRQAVPYLRRFDYEKAIRIYKDYNGPYGPQTASQRNQLIQALRRQQAALLKRTAFVDDLFDGAAKHLLAGELKQARDFVTEGEKNPAINNDARVKNGAALVKQASKLDELIAESFKPSIGKEIPVHLVDMKEKILITSVNGDKVFGQKVMKMGNTVGRIKKEFHVRQLRRRERLKRVSKSPAEADCIMRGLVACESKKSSKGIEEFSKVKLKSLRDALIFYAKLLDQDLEEIARVDFADFLKALGIKQGTQPAMIAKVMQKDYTAVEKINLDIWLKQFVRRFGKTKVAKDNKGFLRALENIISSTSQGASLDTVKKAITELKAENGLPKLKARYENVAGGIRLDLSENPKLKSLAALKSLPVRELILRKTGIVDAKALEGMRFRELDFAYTPLESLKGLKTTELAKLNLAGTRVTDLRRLSKASVLSYLDLSNTNVTDISPLATSSLDFLNLSNCRKLESYIPLASIPSLRRLAVTPDMRNLEQVRHMRHVQRWSRASIHAVTHHGAFWRDMDKTLTDHYRKKYQARVHAAVTALCQKNEVSPGRTKNTLSRIRYNEDGGMIWIAGGAFRDLSPLAGVPISYLSACQTRISDLSPLRGAKIRTLLIYGTQVKSLDPVISCPVELLDIRWTPIPAAHMMATVPKWKNLYGLWYTGAGVENLKFLRGMQLTQLHIRGPEINDLSPIQNMPFTHLGLENFPNVLLGQLREVESIFMLNLYNSKIRSIASVRRMKNLRECTLSHTPVTDFTPLAAPPLWSVHLEKCNVKSLGFLQGKTLYSLGLRETAVTDFSVLQGMKQLYTLDVGGTDFRNTALLAGMTNLRTLHLDNTPIADIGPIPTCANLRQLRLDGCAGLKKVAPLVQLKNLQRLTVPKGAKGIQRLKNLPSLYAVNTEFDNWQMGKEQFFK